MCRHCSNEESRLRRGGRPVPLEVCGGGGLPALIPVPWVACQPQHGLHFCGGCLCFCGVAWLCSWVLLLLIISPLFHFYTTCLASLSFPFLFWTKTRTAIFCAFRPNPSQVSWAPGLAEMVFILYLLIYVTILSRVIYPKITIYSCSLGFKPTTSALSAWCCCC